MNNEATYYLIMDRLVGKKEGYIYYLFENGKWCPDSRCVIMDRLMGYDPTEPAGSPYAIGNGSIMDEIEVITYEKAMELIGGQI